MTVTTDDLPVGTSGTGYSAVLKVNGGKETPTWALASGSLPPGLALAITGVLSGTPTATGTYRIVVTASDASTPAMTVKAALTISIVSPGHTGPVVIDHCGTLAHRETWTSSRVHHLTCPLVVPTGATLTVQPGAVVKAHSGAGIVAKGRLYAPGTSASPATFTSWQDDTAAGDTNGDGSATTPEPGGWNGISATSAWDQPPASIDLHGIEIRYAGLSVDNVAAYNGVANYEPPTISVTGSPE